MSNKSTGSPPPRICILLGGPRRTAPSVELRLAALLRPAPGSLVTAGSTP